MERDRIPHFAPLEFSICFTFKTNKKLNKRKITDFATAEPWDKTPLSNSHAAVLRSKIPCMIPTVFSCVSPQVPCDSSLLSAGQTLSFSLYQLVQWGSDKEVLNDFIQGCDSKEWDPGLQARPQTQLFLLSPASKTKQFYWKHFHAENAQ